MLHERRRGLEALGERTADGLLDQPGSGEADRRSGFGEDHVGEYREARGHAAVGRVHEHRHVRQAGPCEALGRCRGLGHLHEREHALLHPGAARGYDEHDRTAFGDREFEQARDLLAHHRAHGRADEPEVERADRHRTAVDGRAAGDRGVGEPGLGTRLLQSGRIGLACGEAERVDRDERLVGLGERVLVGQKLDAVAGDQVEVVVTVQADRHALGHVALVEGLLALRARPPDAIGKLGAGFGGAYRVAATLPLLEPVVDRHGAPVREGGRIRCIG